MYHYSTFFILISAFLIVNLVFIGAVPIPFISFFELRVRIFLFLSGLLYFSPSSPFSGLSFFTLILLIPFPRSLIFYGAPVVCEGIGGCFSPDSPLEAPRTRLMLSFILPVPLAVEPNDACDYRFTST
jgi:hypothetical protein